MKIVLWRKLDSEGKSKYFVSDISFCCAKMSSSVINIRGTHDFRTAVHIYHNARTSDVEIYKLRTTLSKEFLSECPFCGKHIDIEIVVNHCP